MRTEKELEGVTLLGNQGTKYSDQYNPGVLETFENKHPENEYLVTFKAGKNASSTKTYKYITNPSIKLGNLETVVLNANYDFQPE